MSGGLLGALFAGVSGLDAQASNLSIEANNISNANTPGYKQTEVEFQTLVTGASSSTSFSPGGVLAGNRQLVDQQGLLQSTSSSTDIAIQGSGLFVVNQNSTGSGQVLYTRAGSFTQDSSGNFVNAAGYFLQAWPLDRNGRLPGAPGNANTTSSANLSSLRTVNVQSVAGTASATSTVALSANLNAGETAFPGASGDAIMDSQDATNFGITADTIILPSSTDNLTKNDKMTVTTGLNPTGFTYTYGGFATSRRVDQATGAGDYGDSGSAVPVAITLGTHPFTFTPGSNTITVNQAPPAGLLAHQVVSISGNTTAFDGLSSSALDGKFYVNSVSGGSFTLTLPTGVTAPAATALAANPFTVTSGSTSVTVAGTPPTGLVAGDTVTIAGSGAILDSTGATMLTAGQMNTVHTVVSVAGGSYVITTAAAGGTGTNSGGSSTQGGASVTQFVTTGGTPGAILTPRLFSGDILDATSATTALITTPANFTSAALSFTITTTTTGTSTFTYTASAPNATLGQFSTLDNLATAISDVSGLSARVVNNRLYIAAINGNDAITLANGSATGINGAPPLAGIDWVGELGVANVASSGSASRFSTLQGLANLVNNSAGLTATVNNPLGAADVKINVNDPLDTITFTDGGTNTGSLLAELGLTATLGSQTVPLTTGALGPAYGATTSSKNMASGNITPQFSRPITVFDSLGTSHNLNVGFIKTGSNSWAVEIYAQPGTDVSSASLDGTSGASTTGLVAYGTIKFNGDGSLQSVSSLLSQPITIDWAGGATASRITMNWGTEGAIGTGKTDGLSQFNSAFAVNFVNQNGAPVGGLTAVSISSTGLITASFSNGQTQNLYQIPLASFSDPDQLESVSGNVFAQTSGSGQVNLKQAGNSGVGTISSSSLEQSNVELADQLTQMIVAQRAYQANTKVISTADNLLQALNQIIQ